MNETNCKKSVYMTEIQRRLAAIEQTSEKKEERLVALERNSDVTKERVGMIFDSLDEIKVELKKIREQPINLLWGGVAVGIGAVITYVFNMILK